MTGCCCTQYDDSSKFIIIEGIIIFKHNTDRVVNIMLNQLTSHNAMLQVALLVGKQASRLAAKLKYTNKTDKRRDTGHCNNFADMHTFFIVDGTYIGEYMTVS